MITKLDSPIECPEHLHHTLLTTTMPTRGQLHREGRPGVVVTSNDNALPTVPMSTAIFKFRLELLNLDEIGVGILVLQIRQRAVLPEKRDALTSIYCPGTSISSTFPY